MKPFGKLIIGTLLIAGVWGARAEDSVLCSQTVNLRYGWNAFYLTVTPKESAEEIFSSWPVDRVGWYDPAAFLETKQFSAEGSTEGTVSAGYLVWRRGDEALSSLKRVTGNSIYTCFMTNAAPYTAVLYGTPVAPRFTWHPSSDLDTMNFVGFSLPSGEKVRYTDYFDGLAFDSGTTRKFYRYYGVNPLKVSLGLVSASDTFGNGDVVVVTSSSTSDWSGVLNVTPMEGIDFGLYGRQERLSVRNDGTSDRDVVLTFRASEAKPFGGLPTEVPTGLHFRDSAGAITNEPWRTVAADMSLTRHLAVGEKWELVFAIDRTSFNGSAGTVYGVVAEFADQGASRMRAAVPVMVTDNGERGKGVWPQGLWVASAELDTVTHIGEAAEVGGLITHEVPSGGKMTVRLPVYVDNDGAMWLLQRYEYGYDTNAVMQIASGAVTLDADEVPPAGRRRVSSPFLPTDQPQIYSTNGTFGTTAVFEFTVGERSNVNPMRHAQHPRHDGLMADYSGETPSGDNITNYVSKVKPESFSVVNRIQFAWDGTTAAAWNPEETLGGRVTWEFEGVRHGEGEQDGTLRASGDFIMKRVTSNEVRLEK